VQRSQIIEEHLLGEDVGIFAIDGFHPQ
jgi:hypothetical protein